MNICLIYLYIYELRTYLNLYRNNKLAAIYNSRKQPSPKAKTHLYMYLLLLYNTFIFSTNK